MTAAAAEGACTDAPPAPQPIHAIVYADGVAFDGLIVGLVRRLQAEGRRLAGLVQRNEARPDRAHCDMFLMDLSTGDDLLISVDRGPLAGGCHLDTDAMARAILSSERAIRAGVELLVVNKFGKEEAEGRGFRGAIALAVETGIPVLIGLPERNRADFDTFCGEAAEAVPADDPRTEAWLAAVLS